MRIILAIILLWFLILATTCDAQEIKLGTASWYSTEACAVNPHRSCPTASGKSLYALEAEGRMFGAMWDVPFGSVWKVTNIKNNKQVNVEILDRGPNRRLNRVIDLCKEAFNKIADSKEGLIEVVARRIQ